VLPGPLHAALGIKKMTNLRHPEIRIRDIRKLVDHMSHFLIWDRGCDETSEWVMASLETETHKNKLLAWLSSKHVEPSNQAILIGPAWNEARRIAWAELITEPDKYFRKEMFQLYDIDLKWFMEYQVQQIARFGRYGNNA
jgi:hypothetical protein